MAYDFLYETHMHTSEGSKCATSTAAQQVRAYKERGYTGIIITDHFINGYCTCPRDLSWADKMQYVVKGHTAAKREGDRCGLDVFLGWEFSYRGADFLTYGLGLDFLIAHPNIDKMPPEEYSKTVRKNGGYIAQAHPYRMASYINNPAPYDASILDGIEVFNSSDPSENNKKTMRFAKKHNLPIQAGTDSHSVHVGFSSGIVLNKKAESIDDIITAIKGFNVEIIASL